MGLWQWFMYGILSNNACQPWYCTLFSGSQGHIDGSKYYIFVKLDPWNNSATFQPLQKSKSFQFFCTVITDWRAQWTDTVSVNNGKKRIVLWEHCTRACWCACSSWMLKNGWMTSASLTPRCPIMNWFKVQCQHRLIFNNIWMNKEKKFSYLWWILLIILSVFSPKLKNMVNIWKRFISMFFLFLFEKLIYSCQAQLTVCSEDLFSSIVYKKKHISTLYH